MFIQTVLSSDATRMQGLDVDSTLSTNGLNGYFFALKSSLKDFFLKKPLIGLLIILYFFAFVCR